MAHLFSMIFDIDGAISKFVAYSDARTMFTLGGSDMRKAGMNGDHTHTKIHVLNNRYKMGI